MELNRPAHTERSNASSVAPVTELFFKQKARKPGFELTKPSTGQELQQDTTPHTHTTAGKIHGYV
jgi:hypothetical protein